MPNTTPDMPDTPAPPAMPDTPDTPAPTDDPTINFVGWYDSSLDLLRGLTVTEWGLLDEAPTERRALVLPEAASAGPFAPERRGRLRG